MSNLGRYQEFTTAAKQAGGVDAYLTAMKRGAALRGAGVTFVIGGVILIGIGEVKQRRAVKRAEQEQSNG